MVKISFKSTFQNILFLCVLVLSCSADNVEQNNTLKIGYKSKLIFEDSNALAEKQDAIEHIVKETMALINEKMSVKNITIILRNSPANTIPEVGIGGYNLNENEIIISMNADYSNIDHTISVELGPTIAHEIHHLKRRRSVGYGATLLEACVTEGLADCFAMEIFGIDPPIWSTAISGSELDNLMSSAREVWNNSSHDHYKWFHGTTQDIPRWAGYSIGYKLVKDYISQNPDQKPSVLHDKPASAFEN